MTQVTLAQVTGIEQANISAIETGRRQPSAETLHRLLNGCGFELVATAGARTIPLPPPTDSLLRIRDPDDPPDEPPLASVDTPAQRARVLVAVLDASEAIVRGRMR